MEPSAITLKRRDVRTRLDRLAELEAAYERLPDGPEHFKARQAAQAAIVTARQALNLAKVDLNLLAGTQPTLF